MLRDILRTITLVAVLIGMWARTFDTLDFLEFRAREIYNNGHVQHPLAYSLEQATHALPFHWDPSNVKAVPDVKRVMTHLRSRVTPSTTLISAQEYGVSLNLVYVRSIDNYLFNVHMTDASTEMFTCKMQSGGRFPSKDLSELQFNISIFMASRRLPN
mgnify:CR=1 FL=1